MTRNQSPLPLALYFLTAIAVGQDQPPSETIVLPATRTDADFSIAAPSGVTKPADVKLLPVLTPQGKLIAPQPKMTISAVANERVQIHMDGLFYWGYASLPVQFPNRGILSYPLQRGLIIDSTQVSVDAADRANIWFYNHSTEPQVLHWRLVSGTEAPTNWTKSTIGPARSDSLLLTIPKHWFASYARAIGGSRQALLQVRFGTDDSSPSMPQIPLQFNVDSPFSPLWRFITPPWLTSLGGGLSNLVWVTLLVTFGAVLLMLAQVMIPNFRLSLRMEGQVESLQERLRGIGAQVSNRLLIRCQHEVETLRRSLSARRFSTLSRLALSGNATEIRRLAEILPRAESRMRFTELLDERQSATDDSTRNSIPITIRWNQQQRLKAICDVLSKQAISEGDEKTVVDSFTQLSITSAALKDFAADLELRIGALRRQFAAPPFKAKFPGIFADINGCAELLTTSQPTPPAEGWSVSELTYRDLAAIRLQLIARMIELEPGLAARTGLSAQILKKLESDSPSQLAGAQLDLEMVAEGVFEEDIRKALESGLWDAWCDPSAGVAQRKVVRFWFHFREVRLNNSAASRQFRCYWRVTQQQDATRWQQHEVSEDYEEGWASEVLAQKDHLALQPVIQDSYGHKIHLPDKTPEGNARGEISVKVHLPYAPTVPPRVWRGLVDALLTALVPVVSVAIAQMNSGATEFSADKLILLGFTSQAIRTALVPESNANDART